MEKIENCPCCGGAGEIKDVRGKFRHGWVGCPECGIYKHWTYTPSEAIKIWNRRAS